MEAGKRMLLGELGLPRFAVGQLGRHTERTLPWLQQCGAVSRSDRRQIQAPGTCQHCALGELKWLEMSRGASH